eukprot:g4388.t1
MTCFGALMVIASMARFMCCGVDAKSSRGMDAIMLSKNVDVHAVRKAIKHAWAGYTTHAAGYDDLAPISLTGQSWLHARATLFDSLDTLYLAGLREEFDTAVEEILQNLPAVASTGPLWPAKVFEYHLRVVGGLCGAYALSGNLDLLDAARDAADQVLRAFVSDGLKLPRPNAHMVSSGQPLRHALATIIDHLWPLFDDKQECNSLAGVGSFALEFRFLSRETGDQKYHRAAVDISDAIAAAWSTNENKDAATALPPLWLQVGGKKCPRTEKSTVSAGLGSGGDSFYEYLLKLQLLDPLRTSTEREMYDHLVDGLRQQPFLKYYRRSDGRRIAFIVNNAGRQEHLVCFVPGLLALGSISFPKSHRGDLELAEELMEGCIAMYEDNALGLAPDEVRIANSGVTQAAKYSGYRLRPETLESLFILYRVTGKPRYRAVGRKIFYSIMEHCRVESGGFTGLDNVGDLKPGFDLEEHADDDMPSFFVAETLKYAALLFTEEETLPLSTWVLTTEAHPLPVINRCEMAERIAPQCSRSSRQILPAFSSIFFFPPDEFGALLLIAVLCRRVICRPSNRHGGKDSAKSSRASFVCRSCCSRLSASSAEREYKAR